MAAFCSSSGGERAGDWRRCLSLMGEMDRQGVAPDAPCYKHAVDIAAKVKVLHGHTVIEFEVYIPGDYYS